MVGVTNFKSLKDVTIQPQQKLLATCEKNPFGKKKIESCFLRDGSVMCRLVTYRADRNQSDMTQDEENPLPPPPLSFAYLRHKNVSFWGLN